MLLLWQYTLFNIKAPYKWDDKLILQALYLLKAYSPKMSNTLSKQTSKKNPLREASKRIWSWLLLFNFPSQIM